jgi:hypothetical protein
MINKEDWKDGRRFRGIDKGEKAWYEVMISQEDHSQLGSIYNFVLLTPRSILPTKSLGSPSSTAFFAFPPAAPADLDPTARPPMKGKELRKYHAKGKISVKAMITRSMGEGMMDGFLGDVDGELRSED